MSVTVSVITWMFGDLNNRAFKLFLYKEPLKVIVNMVSLSKYSQYTFFSLTKRSISCQVFANMVCEFLWLSLSLYKD